MTLTEAQAKANKIPSKLLPYLANKSKAKLDDLFESNPTASTSSFPTLWTDPSILCQTNAYEITQQGQLPDALKEIAREASNTVIRSYSDLDTKLIILGNSEIFRVYRHGSELTKQTKSIAVSDLSHNQVSPLFDIWIDDDCKCIKMMLIGTQGKTRYYANLLEDHYINHQLPLSAGEYITTVKFVNTTLTVIGSSTGEIYLMNLESDSISTFYRHSMRLESFSFVNHFCIKSIPHASEEMALRFAPSRAINSIRVVANLCFVSDLETVSIWQIEDPNTVKLLLRKNVENDIISNVARHVPSQISRKHIQCEIIDMSVITKYEIVILASYSVPDMGDYVQYAIITFIVEQDDNQFIMYAKHTCSIPFSAIPSSLKIPPQLHITNDIGFILFDKTVIATSLERKSVFEESVVLEDPDDAILCINVFKSPTNKDCAIIFTAKSNVLKYQIDAKKIQESRTTGNMYAGIVENALERDTMVFKSRLTQAVFFGASHEIPIQFPLRVEQEDVHTAVMSLSRDIKTGQCELIPESLDFELLVESRYYFEKRIYKVLKENMLLDLLSSEDRLELFTDAENYFLCIVLWEYFEQRVDDIYLHQAIVEIIQSITKPSIKDILSLAEFLRSQAFSTKELLNQIRSFKSSDEASWVNHSADIIMLIIHKALMFEEKYIAQYGLQKNQIELISVDICDILIDMFKQNVHCLKELAMDKNSASLDDETGKSIGSRQTMSKNKLVEAATVLLDTLKNDSSHKETPTFKYKNTRKLVIEGLSSIGHYEQAMHIAEKHDDVPCVVESVQLSAKDIKSKNVYYIELFGEEYFICLMQYLYKQDSSEQRSMMMELSMQFSNLASEFFKDIICPRVSWIYYLKTKQYTKSLDALKQCLETENNNLTIDERNELESWHTMILAVVTENSSHN